MFENQRNALYLNKTARVSYQDGIASHIDLKWEAMLRRSEAWRHAYAAPPSAASGDVKARRELCASHQTACHSKKASTRRISSRSSWISSSHRCARALALHHSTRKAVTNSVSENSQIAHTTHSPVGHIPCWSKHRAFSISTTLFVGR